MAELRRGELTTPADFYERVARLRFYVQLLSVRGPASHHDLPDGLSPETNPHAEAHWEGTEGAELLLEVAGYVHANVCAQETLFRALLGCCHRFNRTAARLQAEIDSRDFTRPTRPAS